MKLMILAEGDLPSEDALWCIERSIIIIRVILSQVSLLLPACPF